MRVRRKTDREGMSQKEMKWKKIWVGKGDLNDEK